MTRKQVMRPEAQDDLDEAIRWYKANRPGQARKFAAEVKSVLRLLRKMPMIHGIIVDDVRRAVIKGYAYVILYRVTDTEVIIISIFHTSQDPGKWQARI